MPKWSDLPTTSPATLAAARDTLGIPSIEQGLVDQGQRLLSVEDTLSNSSVNSIQIPSTVVTFPEDSNPTGNVLSSATTSVGSLRIIQFWVIGQLEATSAGLPKTISDVGDITIYFDGEWSFVPKKDWNGVAPIIQFMATNGQDVRVSSLSITMSSVDDPPVAGGNSAMTPGDTPVTFGVLGNDYDPEGDAISLTHVNNTPVTVGDTVAVPNGSILINSGFTLTFTPDLGFLGNSIFQYTISSNGLSSQGTINIQVGFENIPLISPVAPIVEGDYFDEAALNFGNTAMKRFGPLYNNGVNVTDATYSAGQGNYDLGQREPWLYDRATQVYKLYLRTKDESIRLKALEFAQLYMSNVVITYDKADFAIPGGQPGDPKYLYPIIAWWYERETGSTEFRQKADALYNQAFASFPVAYSSGAGLWTERNMNYALQAALAHYWIFGNPTSLQRAEAYFSTLITMAASTGAPLHPHSQHEGSSISTPVTSPWMGALLVETLLQLYRTNGDIRILSWISRYCDFIADHAFYINNEAIEFLGKKVPAYLVGTTIRYPSDGGGWDDGEHSFDVAHMLMKGVWAKQVLGQDPTQLNALIPEQFEVARAVFDIWTRTTPGLPHYRVNPPRKWAWWQNGAYSRNYFFGVVPLPPINLTPPTLSGNLPEGSTLTITPGTWAGDPTPVFTYQLLRNGEPIPGATELTYITTSLDVGAVLTPSETATNTGGVVTKVGTSSITPTALGSPVITQQPQSVTAEVDTPVYFNVVFTGNPTPSVQWQVSTNQGGSWSDIPGETYSTYSIPSLPEVYSGYFIRCRISNTGDTIYSNVVTLFVAAQIGAVTFDPSEGLSLVQSIFPPGLANFTIQALVRFNAANFGNRKILTNEVAADRTASLGFADNYPDYTIGIGDSSSVYTPFPTNRELDKWYLVTFMGDANLNPGIYTGVYQDLNGGPQFQITKNKATPELLNHVAVRVNGGGQPSAGAYISVQHVRAFASQHSLSTVASEVFGTNTSEALFWWVFESNGVGGFNVRDASGNNRIPTVVGGTYTSAGPITPIV